MLVMSDNRTQECPSDVDLTSLNWLHNLDIMSNMSVPSLPTPPDSPAPPSDKCASGGSAKKNCIQRPKSVDYRTDGESKPPYSYAMLICMAMKANNNKMTLSAIYKWIRDNFLYYKNAEPSWQNSIRHNLSLNKCFIKIPRSKDEPGKGGFWQLDPAYAEREEEGMFKRRRLTTSTPSGNNASRNRRNRNSRKVVQPAKNHILLQPLPAAPMLTPTATPSPGPSCIEVSVPMAVSNNFDATFFLPEELLVPSTGCSVEGAHTQLSPLSIKLEEFNQSEASECCGVDQDLERLLTAWDDTPIDFESLLDFASL